MKGILFTGGQGPGIQRCIQLVKDASIIVAADSGLLLARRSGIKPDIIIGDMDSLGVSSILNEYQAESIIKYSHNKDFTDTELALDYLFNKDCDTVWIIGGGGGRLDHLLAVFYLFNRIKSPARWITDNEDIFYLNEGLKLVKKAAEHSIVSVFPLGDGPWQLQSENLKWPVDFYKWEKGKFGISNRTVKNMYSLKSIMGKFLIIQNNPDGDD